MPMLLCNFRYLTCGVYDQCLRYMILYDAWRFANFYFLTTQSRLVWALGGADTGYKVKYSFGRSDHIWTFVDEKTRDTLTVNLLFAGGLYVEGQDGCGGSDPGIGLARARYPSTSDVVILDAATWELSV